MMSRDQLGLKALRALVEYPRPSGVVFRHYFESAVAPANHGVAERVVEEFGRRHGLHPQAPQPLGYVGEIGTVVQSGEPDVLKAVGNRGPFGDSLTGVQRKKRSVWSPPPA